MEIDSDTTNSFNPATDCRVEESSAITINLEGESSGDEASTVSYQYNNNNSNGLAKKKRGRKPLKRKCKPSEYKPTI